MIAILGIHDGHNSGATLLQDGEITFSISEERLTRNKNEIGYPKNSINEVLKLGKLHSKELDKIVYSSNFMHSASHLKNASEWYKAGKADLLRDSKIESSYLKAVFDKRKNERINQISEHLKIDPNIIKFHEHHLCHGAAAYFGSTLKFDKDTLITTCDGAGDGISATVSIAKGFDINRIASTKRKHPWENIL